MTSVSGPRIDPAPLFDQVTGLPPENAVDVTVPVPLSLSVYMTVLESSGRAAELAVLRKLHIDQARETVRSIQARIGDITAPAAAPGDRLRVTHIVEQRVPRVNGLRPHVHAFVGVDVRAVDGDRGARVDVGRLTVLTDPDLFLVHRDGLVRATTESLGLEWGETSWSPCELLGPRWVADRAEQLRHDALPCRGPWPRHQIVVGRGGR